MPRSAIFGYAHKDARLMGKASICVLQLANAKCSSFFNSCILFPADVVIEMFIFNIFIKAKMVLISLLSRTCVGRQH